MDPTKIEGKGINDEGYSDKLVRTNEMPEFMLNWSDTQKADFAYSLLLTLPTSSINTVTTRLAPLLHRDFISELPLELASHILKFCSDTSLHNCRLVSKRWSKLSEDQALWKYRFIADGFGYNRKLVCYYVGGETGFDVDTLSTGDIGSDEHNDTSDQVRGSDSMGEVDRFVREFTHLGMSPEPSASGIYQVNEVTNNNTLSITIDGMDSFGLSGRDTEDSFNQGMPSPLFRNFTDPSSSRGNRVERNVVEASPQLTPSSPMVSQFRLPNSTASPRTRPFAINVPYLSDHLTHQPRNLMSPLTDFNQVPASPFLNTPGLFSEVDSPLLPNLSEVFPPSYLHPLPGMGPFNPFDHISPKFQSSRHVNPNTGDKMINWRYLHNQRKLLERNWVEGRYEKSQIPGHAEGIYCIQFDKFKIVSGSRDQTIKVFDLQTSRCLRTMRGHTGSVLCLQYQGSMLVSGSSDGTIIIWDLNTGEKVNQLHHHTDSVLNLKFDDKYIISCSKDRTAKVWSIETGKLVHSLEGHRIAVNAIEFNSTIIATGSGDRTLRIWDLNTGTCIKVLEGHKRGIACLQLYKDKIYSGSSDYTIKIWSLTNYQLLHTLSGHVGLVRTLHLCPYRNVLVSGSYDHSIKIWDLNTNSLILDLVNGHVSRVFKLQVDLTKIVSCSQDTELTVWDFAANLDTTFLI